MRIIAGCGLMLMLSGLGCATTPPSVPVSGTAADLSQLAGEWNGEYNSNTGGRSGVITFQLAAGADTAHGDVIMFPRQGRTTMSGDTPNTAYMAIPQGLSIRFVRTADGQGSGALDPYRDPDCDCMVTTTFEGRLRGDTIEGRYVSIRSGEAESMRGVWKVKRKRP